MNQHLNAVTRCISSESTKMPEYGVWRAMIRRCRNKNVKDFHRYGGRGITVCERWNIFENFIYDMGRRPNGLTLERKDTNGNYEPDNCKWTTWKEQQSNRRDNHFLTVDGIKKTLSQWSELVGINQRAIGKRIARGWTAKESISIPLYENS